MNAYHNHSPRCCCDDVPELGGTGECPACPEHGVQPPTVECPECHQEAGRPHTDYCSLQLREDVFAGETLRTPAEWANLDGCLILDPDGWRYPTSDAKPFDEPITRAEYERRLATSTVRARIGQTSQPATRTSQPPTQHRCPDGERCQHPWHSRPVAVININGDAGPDLVDKVSQAIRAAQRRNGQGH